MTIKGKPIDAQTRCEHYHSPLDIIAIKFYCCREYYPCYTCHEETAGHAARLWPVENRDEQAVLCGVCKHEMTINEYFNSGNQCPECGAGFNPNCERHYHLYFDFLPQRR